MICLIDILCLPASWNSAVSIHSFPARWKHLLISASLTESLRARRIADARVQHWKSLFSSGLATAGDKSTFVVIERADGDGQYYTIDGNHRLSALLELKDK